MNDGQEFRPGPLSEAMPNFGTSEICVGSEFQIQRDTSDVKPADAELVLKAGLQVTVSLRP